MRREARTPITTPMQTDTTRKRRKLQKPSISSKPSTVLICISMIVRNARMENTSDSTVSPSRTATICDSPIVSRRYGNTKFASQDDIAAANAKRFHVEKVFRPSIDVTLEYKKEKRNINTNHVRAENKLMGLTFLMNTGKLSENLRQTISKFMPIVEHLQRMKKKVDYRNVRGIAILICLIILVKQFISLETL